jgi:ribonucleotide reductase alpha subunit
MIELDDQTIESMMYLFQKFLDGGQLKEIKIIREGRIDIIEAVDVTGWEYSFKRKQK